MARNRVSRPMPRPGQTGATGPAWAALFLRR